MSKIVIVLYLTFAITFFPRLFPLSSLPVGFSWKVLTEESKFETSNTHVRGSLGLVGKRASFFEFSPLCIVAVFIVFNMGVLTARAYSARPVTTS